jgi:hypothetical protein
MLRRLRNRDTTIKLFFHTMQAIRTRVFRGDFNLYQRDWDVHIKKSFQQMSLCYTRDDFAEKINLFKRRWQSHTEFIKYLDDGYFNLNSWKSNWYLIPVNNLEAFGVVRTNNFIESFNRKLKALLVKGRIMPLRGVVLAFKTFSKEFRRQFRGRCTNHLLVQLPDGLVDRVKKGLHPDQQVPSLNDGRASREPANIPGIGLKSNTKTSIKRHILLELLNRCH